jgi:hypothetical protein
MEWWDSCNQPMMDDFLILHEIHEIITQIVLLKKFEG